MNESTNTFPEEKNEKYFINDKTLLYFNKALQ